jgi:hypothetical protein
MLVILPGFEAMQCTPPCVLSSAQPLSVDNCPECLSSPFCLCNFVSKIQLTVAISRISCARTLLTYFPQG